MTSLADIAELQYMTQSRDCALDVTQLVREVTFFSRISKSLRLTFDLSSSKMRFTAISRIPNFSVFFPTCSNMLSNLFCMSGIASRTGWISDLRASISAPTSVELNLSSFFIRFSMINILIENCSFVNDIYWAGIYWDSPPYLGNSSGRAWV